MEGMQSVFRKYQEKFTKRAAQLLKEGNAEGAKAMAQAASWVMDMELKVIESEVNAK